MSDKEKPPVFKDVGIKFEGKHIVLPVDAHGRRMPYKTAAQVIASVELAEEKVVTVNAELPSMGWDGVIAFCRAIKEHFGFTNMSDTPATMFSPKAPPRMFQVEMPDGTFETAIIGRIEPPMFEGGFIECMPGPMSVMINGNVKRKHEDDVKALLERTKRLLATQSMYKGQAVEMNLSWYQDVKNENIPYNPYEHAPKFLQLGGIHEGMLLLNESVRLEIDSNIWLRLKRNAGCIANGVPLKDGFLLAGPFGTGKTLTGMITAAKARDAGWSFIYLKPTVDLAMALKLAEMYAPTVLYAEDISSVVGKDRDNTVETIMNALDGIDNKHKPIMTILTTNYEDSIYAGMLRAGRIGTTIMFETPDESTAMQLVRHYAKDSRGRNLLGPLTAEDEARIGGAYKGIIPAFIDNALQKAKLYAMRRLDSDEITGHISADDLVFAVRASEAQRKRCEEKKEVTHPEKVQKAWDFLHNRGDLVLQHGNGDSHTGQVMAVNKV